MYYVLIRESCKAWVGGQIFAKLTPKLEKSQITRIKISWRKEFIVLKIIIQHLWPRHIFCLWYEDIIRTKLFAFIGEAEVETTTTPRYNNKKQLSAFIGKAVVDIPH